MSPARRLARPLSPSLRRAAARPARPRRRPPARLLEAARAGLLTRSNTRPGTVGRQAVHRATYERRLQLHGEGTTARGALGHRVPGAPPTAATFFADDPPRLLVVEGLSRRDVSRAARYLRAVRQLLNDLEQYPEQARRIKAAFGRRMRGWRSIGGVPVLADADAVIALATQTREAGEPIMFESGRRAARARR